METATDVAMDAPPAADVLAAFKSEPAAATVPDIPENATETVYINNLNEKIKIPILKESLTSLFRTYGTVLSVTAHRSVRMRGQAFVAFPDKDVAAKAVKEVNGFPLYGKPMQLSFAKMRSDAVVKKLDEGSFEEHKKARLEHKARNRRGNELRRKELAKKIAEKKAAAGEGPSVAPAPKKAAVQMPDEYLPPNTILFVQNIRPEIGRAELENLFHPYPGLKDVRIIPVPGKPPIAFVEFNDIPSATAAREGVNGHSFGVEDAAPEDRLRITFARS